MSEKLSLNHVSETAAATTTELWCHSLGVICERGPLLKSTVEYFLHGGLHVDVLRYCVLERLVTWWVLAMKEKLAVDNTLLKNLQLVIIPQDVRLCYSFGRNSMR
jgi:hypothetical protein